MSALTVQRSLVRCPNCRCGSEMHLADGCQTAIGFICNCHLTAEQVLAARSETTAKMLITFLDATKVVDLHVDFIPDLELTWVDFHNTNLKWMP